jgi:hypothetical protein
MLRVLGATSVMALVTYAAKTASSGHGLLTLLSVLGAGGVAYAGAAFLFDVAGVRTSVVSFLWPRSVPAE